MPRKECWIRSPVGYVNARHVAAVLRQGTHLVAVLASGREVPLGIYATPEDAAAALQILWDGLRIGMATVLYPSNSEELVAVRRRGLVAVA